MADILDRLTDALSDRYSIERKLGEGGMATVYLARDIKHDRLVALKVLRPELAAVLGAERFLNEIKVTAKLQHPNILPLYDSGEADTFLYYVMPLVEGETLRDKLDHETQLGVAETLEIAKSVAAALQYAHERNIVHRDIKPENILLQSGQALVADFGIALAIGSADRTRMTDTGLSIGTPHYMSPEQAMGAKEITAKSDVYALGCMVYEMLVGEPPFTGPTAQAIVAKVLVDRPRPVRQLRATVPPHVEAAVDTALEKLPADRFDSAAAFAAVLDDIAYKSTTPGSGPAAASRWWKPAAIGTLGLATVSAIVFLLPILRPGPGGPFTELPLTRSGLARHPSLSPDGQFLVYTSDYTQLVFSEAHGGGQRVLVDTAEDLTFPRFSPDGREILFIAEFAGGQGIYGIPRLGGPPRLVKRVEVREGVGFDYNPDGREIVATGDDPGTVDFVDLATLRVRSVQLDQDLERIWRLAWSPDGKWIAFMGQEEAGSVVVGIMSPDGVVSARELFLGPPLALRWSHSADALYYFQPDDEWDFVVRRVDSKTGEFRADPELLILNVMNFGGPEGGTFDIDRSGTRMVYTKENVQHAVVTFEAARDPQFRELTRSTGWISDAVISPDGMMVAYPKSDHLGLNIYRQPFDGGEETAISAVEGEKGNMIPAWSPTGDRVAFRAMSDTAPERLVTITVPGGQVDPVPFRSWPEGLWSGVQFLSETRLLVSGPQGPGVYDLSDESYVPLDIPDSLARHLDPHDGPAHALFASDERYAVADPTGAFFVGDLRAGTLRMVARFEAKMVWPIGRTDGSDIYSVVFAEDHEAIWRVPEAGGPPYLVLQLPAGTSCGSVSRDGSRMACLRVVSHTKDLWWAENFDPNR